MKIKNKVTTVTLGSNYTVDTMCGPKVYKKGTRFNSNGLTNDGVYMVEGHGIGHRIPRELFTKYTLGWTEVEEKMEGNVKVVSTVRKTKDVTKDWMDMWKKRDDKKEKEQRHKARVWAKNRIAEIRRQIKFVKSGEAELELAEKVLGLKLTN